MYLTDWFFLTNNILTSGRAISCYKRYGKKTPTKKTQQTHIREKYYLCALDKILYANKLYLPEFSLWGELNPDPGGLLLLVSWSPNLRKMQPRTDTGGFRSHGPTWYSLRPQIQCHTIEAIYPGCTNLKRSGLRGTHNIVRVCMFIPRSQSELHVLYVYR